MADFLRVSYELDAATVERVVTQRLPGTYVLGHKRTGSMFNIAFVGRADNNLNVRLKQLADSNSYTAFMYQYCETAKHAFEAECTVFHTFAPPDNKAHPTRPTSSAWKCPSCELFG